MDKDHASRIAAIEAQLVEGRQRMDAMQDELSENTSVTKDIKDILEAGRSGLKVLGGLGEIAKWVGYLSAGILGAWSLFQAWKTGAPPRK